MRPTFTLSAMVLGFLMLFPSHSLFADTPSASPEDLHEMASHVVVGTVVQVYTHEEKDQYWKKTDYVAEVLVKKVKKGSEISEGDHIFAKYWHQKWIGDSDISKRPVGWNGQLGPSSGSTVLLYVRKSAKGYKVVEPNGFALPGKTKADGNQLLTPELSVPKRK